MAQIKKTSKKTTTPKPKTPKDPNKPKTPRKKKGTTAAAAVPTPAPIPKIPTVVSFILDESGSMSPYQKEVINGFNYYIASLRSKGESDDYRLSVTKFSNYAKTSYTNRPLSQVETLNYLNYRPAGGTALYDAIWDNVNGLAPQLLTVDGHRQSAIVVIFTDGEENSSFRANRSMITSLIKAKESEGNWTFVYLGANQDSWRVAEGLGVQIGNVANFYVANSSGVLRDMAVATVSNRECMETDRSRGLAPQTNT